MKAEINKKAPGCEDKFSMNGVIWIYIQVICGTESKGCMNISITATENSQHTCLCKLKTVYLILWVLYQ